jgi:hypothetical protein
VNVNVECYGRSHPIRDDEPNMTLTYNIEPTNAGVVVVDTAESFLTTCIDCTPPRQVIIETLRDRGLPCHPIRPTSSRTERHNPPPRTGDHRCGAWNPVTAFAEAPRRSSQ